MIPNDQCNLTYIILEFEIFRKNGRLRLALLHGFGGCAMLDIMHVMLPVWLCCVYLIHLIHI